MVRLVQLLAAFAALILPAAASVTLTVAAPTTPPPTGAYIQVDLNNCSLGVYVNSSTLVPQSQRFFLNGQPSVTFTIADNVTGIVCPVPTSTQSAPNLLSYYTISYFSFGQQTVLKSVELPPGILNLAALTNITQAPYQPGSIAGPVGPAGPCITNTGTTPFCPVSSTEAWISQIGCPQGADLGTGNLFGTTTPAADAGPCITNYLNAHALPGIMLILHQDGGSVSSGIFGPAAGGWGIISDIDPGIKLTTITGGNVTSGVATFNTTTNSLRVGESVLLNNFAASSYLNGTAVIVASATSYQFTATVSYANATLDTGIGHTLIGNGFFQRSGSNNDIIHNGISTANCVNGYSDPGWTTPGPAPSRGAGLIFRNLMLNGNRGNGYTGNSNTGSVVGYGSFQSVYGSAYCSFMGINAMNVDYVTIEGNQFYHTSSYDVRLMNSYHDQVNRNHFTPFGPGVVPTCCNTDGLHISAPAGDIHADANTLGSGDDSVALNAAEGWVGPISDVSVTNSVYESAVSGGRMYTYSIPPPTGDAAPTIDHVTFDGATGTIQGRLFNLGGGDLATHTQSVQNTMRAIKFANWNVTMKSSLYPQQGSPIGENIQDLTYDNFTVEGIYSTTDNPAMFNVTNGSRIHSWNLNNIVMNRTAIGASNAAFININNNNGTNAVDRLNIDGIRAVASDGSTPTPLPYIVAISAPSTIGNLYTCGVDMNSITALLANPAQTSSIADCQNRGGNLQTSNVVPATGSGPGTATSIFGTDSSHALVFTTGTTTTANSLQFTVNFTASRGHSTYCTLTPANAYASALTGANQVFSNGSTGGTSYTVYSGSTALTASTAYAWNVSCP